MATQTDLHHITTAHEKDSFGNVDISRTISSGAVTMSPELFEKVAESSWQCCKSDVFSST